jgi:hypothetical protein
VNLLPCFFVVSVCLKREGLTFEGYWRIYRCKAREILFFHHLFIERKAAFHHGCKKGIDPG